MNETKRIYNGSEFAKTCPNCGAAIEGEKCAYCGTVFIDFGCIDADKPFFMKLKRGDEIHIAKVRLTSITFNADPIGIYADNRLHAFAWDRSLNMDFQVLNIENDERICNES